MFPCAVCGHHRCKGQISYEGFLDGDLNHLKSNREEGGSMNPTWKLQRPQVDSTCCQHEGPANQDDGSESEGAPSRAFARAFIDGRMDLVCRLRPSNQGAVYLTLPLGALAKRSGWHGMRS